MAEVEEPQPTLMNVEGAETNTPYTPNTPTTAERTKRIHEALKFAAKAKDEMQEATREFIELKAEVEKLFDDYHAIGSGVDEAAEQKYDRSVAVLIRIDGSLAEIHCQILWWEKQACKLFGKMQMERDTMLRLLELALARLGLSSYEDDFGSYASGLIIEL